MTLTQKFHGVFFRHVFYDVLAEDGRAAFVRKWQPEPQIPDHINAGAARHVHVDPTLQRVWATAYLHAKAAGGKRGELCTRAPTRNPVVIGSRHAVGPFTTDKLNDQSFQASQGCVSADSKAQGASASVNDCSARSSLPAASNRRARLR